MITQLPLALFAALGVCAFGAASAPNRAIPLQRLIETSERRLALAEQVALAKWDSHAPVEDPAREAQVVMFAVKQGEARSLDRKLVADFFAAQIEANKVIQYHLLGEWRRRGVAPAHKPIDLGAVRQQLDRIQLELIQALVDIAAPRATPTCRIDVAKAAAKYSPSNPHFSRRLLTVGLDRALGAVCDSR